MKKIYPFILLSLIAFTVNACAFRPAEEPQVTPEAEPTAVASVSAGETAQGKVEPQFTTEVTSIPSASPSPLPSPSPRMPVISAQVAWWVDGKGKSPVLTRALQWQVKSRVAKAELPVTLPPAVPDRVEVELSFSTSLVQLDPTRVLIQVAAASGKSLSGSPKQVIVASRTPEMTDALIEIDGFHQLLASSKEDSLELRILIQTPEGETPLTAVFTMRTPPASIETHQNRTTDSGLDGLANASELKTVRIQGLDHYLLQISKIKNHSNQPIEVQVPIVTQAQLKLFRTSYRAAATGSCSYAATKESGFVPWPQIALLLPLSTDLPKKLARNLTAQELGKVTVPANQETRVGIYMSGPYAEAIASGHFVKSQPEKLSLPDHCEARCDHKRSGPEEFSAYWKPSTIKASGVPEQQIQDCIDCGSGIQKGCDSCMAWENQDRYYEWSKGGSYAMFCGEIIPGGMNSGFLPDAKPEWRLETINADNVLNGNEDGALTLDTDPTDALLTLRFANGSAADDPGVRQVKFLESSVKQDQE